MDVKRKENFRCDGKNNRPGNPYKDIPIKFSFIFIEKENRKDKDKGYDIFADLFEKG